MESKYKVSLHIQRETDGQEVVLQFNENQTAEISSTDGLDYGRFRLVAEGLPQTDTPEIKGTFDQCLKYCTIDEGNTLAYCLAICAAAAP